MLQLAAWVKLIVTEEATVTWPGRTGVAEDAVAISALNIGVSVDPMLITDVLARQRSSLLATTVALSMALFTASTSACWRAASTVFGYQREL